MRSIYEPGQEGFLPTFGPSFLNFFGFEKLKRLKWFKEKEKDMIKEDEGSKYLARLLVSVDCTDYVDESVQRTFIDHSSLLHSKNFEKVHRYNVYCSFFACNLINPLFASDEITFMVSMGEYGSTGTNASHNRSSVLGVLPDHDDTKYFSMPWGNHKPMADVPGLWEHVDARMERSNAIKKISLPDIIIKMLAANKVVGYIKVPARKIFFSENEALSGEWCGQMQALTMAWPTAADRKSRQENFPAVVHARMWFGKRGFEWSWKEAIMPAEIKTYFEIFSYQSNWVVRNSHDMWVCSSDGRATIDDKLFEVHEWRDKKADHRFRRRCIKRTRKAVNFQNENFETYQQSLGDTKWEDLLPVVKNSARGFLRVNFLTKSKETLVVDNSLNPVWNETIIFDKPFSDMIATAEKGGETGLNLLPSNGKSSLPLRCILGLGTFSEGLFAITH
ncbi:unnamed protein product [Angiostrongylus costaricensis]|uniref:FerB domain-containing protein n=1 Tax=Angiostrongylus costaricensis TaxID=334426 RepID=A0A158PLI6_ANGCS|nr:unnamed protein product [Angiostrongylus costaricensis]